MEQITIRVQPISRSRINQAEDDCTTLGTVRGVGEQEILPKDHKGLNATFGSVVAQFQPAVFEIGQQIGALFLQVVQHLT